MILSRTTGFAAFMRILPNIFEEIGNVEEIPSQFTFFEIIKKSKLKSGEFTSDNFKPGSSGESELVRRLSLDLFQSIND